MPGPPPKDPKLRQRKNVEITATTFVESSQATGPRFLREATDDFRRTPKTAGLPKRFDHETGEQISAHPSVYCDA